MCDPDPLIDEHMLASFIAGTLSKERRDTVVEYLASNSDAREVLQMAYQALEAARTGEPEIAARSTYSKLRPGVRKRSADRPAARNRILRGASRYVAATVIVFVVGVVLRLAFGPPTDALRSPLPRGAESLEVQVDEGPEFSWTEVSNAYHYRIVVWDPQEARVVGQYETTDFEVDSTHPIFADLESKLRPGDSYTLRVDAVDAQNRLVRSSETVQFTTD